MAVVFSVVLMAGATLWGQAPVVPQGGVVNGASFRPANASGGGVAPGSIISIFGSNLAPSTALAANIPLPTSLAGASVTIGGVAAGLFFVSASQINAQLPFSVPAGARALALVVKTAGGSSAPVNVSVLSVAPGLFSQAVNGRGPGAVLNFVSQGNTPVNTPASTIGPNGIVLLYGTGFGPVNSPPADGDAGSGQTTTTTPVVMIGGRQAAVDFSGLAPGFVGLYQINAHVPGGTPDGCFLPVTVAFGSAISNTITVSVMSAGGNCDTAATGSPSPFQGGSLVSAGLNKFTIQFANPLPIPVPPSPDKFAADFARYNTGLPYTDAGLPPVNGGCIVSVSKPNPNVSMQDILKYGNPGQPLDAGMLTLSASLYSSVTITAQPGNPGKYRLDLSGNGLVPGSWTLSGSGGADVGPFSATLTVPGPLFNVTSFGIQGGAFSRSQPLQIAWSCPDPQAQVGVIVQSVDTQNSLFGTAMCSFACGANAGTIGTDVLGQLPVSSQFGAGILVALQSNPALSPRIQPTGIDLGIFTYSIGSGMFGTTLTRPSK